MGYSELGAEPNRLKSLLSVAFAAPFTPSLRLVIGLKAPADRNDALHNAKIITIKDEFTVFFIVQLFLLDGFKDFNRCIRRVGSGRHKR
mmetsp:Transcript_16410/g.37983  ORF Transcript_16410/g.37983 Transcript_16410/m.37983 type:complete len:89 (+) Transcript_16410:1620-1886(+)